jgi:hypothetical protein
MPCWTGNLRVFTTKQSISSSHLKTKRQQATRSGVRAKEEGPPSIQEDWHHPRGLAYLSAHGGNKVAEMGEHQLTVRDYLRTATFTSRTSTCTRHQRRSAGHRTNWSTPSCLGGFLRKQTLIPVSLSFCPSRPWRRSLNAYRPLTSADCLGLRVSST